MKKQLFKATYKNKSTVSGTVYLKDRKILFHLEGSSEALFSWDEYSISCYAIKNKTWIQSTLHPNQELVVDDIEFKSVLEEGLGIQVGKGRRDFRIVREVKIAIGAAVGIILLTVIFLAIARANSEKIAQWITPEYEKSLGDDIYKENFAKEVVQLPEDANSQWTKLTDKLTQLPVLKDKDWKIYIIKESEPNAFAIPGNYAFFTTGFLLQADSPEEILGVLAHEIAHTTKRHTIHQYVSNNITQFTFGFILGEGISIVGRGFDLLSEFKFSRLDEAEADSVGLSYLQEAGISASGMSQFFHKQIQKRGSDNSSWISTHPADEDRIMVIENHERRYPVKNKIDFSLKSIKAAIEGSH